MTQQELELPEGWVKSPLKKLLQKNVTYGILKNGDFDQNGIPMLRVMDLSKNGTLNNTEIFMVSKDIEKNYKRTRLNENDLIISVAATLGRSMVVQKSMEGFNVNRALAIIRLIKPLSPQFLHYFIQSPFFCNLIKNKKVGTAQQVINLRDLSEFPILLPPLNEQKRIVSKIEELFSKIDSTKKSLEYTKLQLKLYRQSLLKSIFEGKDITKSKKSTIGEISEKIFKGIFDLSPQNYVVKGIPFLRISNIIEGVLNLSNCKYISKKIHESNKGTMVSGGDIVLAKVGSISSDKVAIIPTGYGTMNTNQNLMGIRLRKDLCRSKFVYHWLRYQKNMDKLLDKSKATTFKSIRNSDLAQLVIFIPTLEEQEQIVSKIEQGFSLIQNSQRIVNSTLQTLETMRMSVLKQAFEGKLVPQDPNDEPAEILLERIKNR